MLYLSFLLFIWWPTDQNVGSDQKTILHTNYVEQTALEGNSILDQFKRQKHYFQDFIWKLLKIPVLQTN